MEKSTLQLKKLALIIGAKHSGKTTKAMNTVIGQAYTVLPKKYAELLYKRTANLFDYFVIDEIESIDEINQYLEKLNSCPIHRKNNKFIFVGDIDYNEIPQEIKDKFIIVEMQNFKPVYLN